MLYVFPGTQEERGLVQWKAGANANSETSEQLTTYDFPFGMGVVKKIQWLKYVPVCPVFKGFKSRTQREADTAEHTSNSDIASICTKV